MEWAALAAMVTAVSGAIFGVFKWVVEFGRFRRIERLLGMYKELPDKAYAKQAVAESLDWETARIAQRARGASSPWGRTLGIALVSLGFGAMGTSAFLTPGEYWVADPFTTMREIPHVVLLLLGGSVVAALGYSALFFARATDKRRAQLAKLADDEARYIIAIHALKDAS